MPVTAPPPQVKALDARDICEVAGRLSDLNVPARVVWGTGDIVRKIEHGEGLARDLHPPLRLIAGANHFTPKDHPDGASTRA